METGACHSTSCLSSCPHARECLGAGNQPFHKRHLCGLRRRRPNMQPSPRFCLGEYFYWKSFRVNTQRPKATLSSLLKTQGQRTPHPISLLSLLSAALLTRSDSLLSLVRRVFLPEQTGLTSSQTRCWVLGACGRGWEEEEEEEAQLLSC